MHQTTQLHLAGWICATFLTHSMYSLLNIPTFTICTLCHCTWYI